MHIVFRGCLLELFGKERVRYGCEHAGSVARVVVAATRATMCHSNQHRFGILRDLVRRLAINAHDESDAARVLFKRRVIQADILGQTSRFVNFHCKYVFHCFGLFYTKTKTKQKQ